MLRRKFHNLAIAFGIVLLYTGLASSAAGIQQAAKSLQDESFYPIEIPVDPEISNFLSPSIAHTIGEPIEDAQANNAEQTSKRNTSEAPVTYNPIDPSQTRIIPNKESLNHIFPVTPADPVRITIPTIELDAPVVQAEISWVAFNGGKYKQWEVPNSYSAGWHETSAKLGESGNTVFNGHNNVYGEVFRRLDELMVGDLIQVYSETQVFEYVITNTMILPERFQEIDVRMNNAQWILPSDDQRLTLISCWPYQSNTHRVIVVAKLIFINDQPGQSAQKSPSIR